MELGFKDFFGLDGYANIFRDYYEKAPPKEKPGATPLPEPPP